MKWKESSYSPDYLDKVEKLRMLHLRRKINHDMREGVLALDAIYWRTTE